MNTKLYLILTWIGVICSFACGIEDGQGDKIRIYLPREKTLSSEMVELGQIAVILGDESSVQLANRIQLGQFTVSGQSIDIDRRTIVSRLASSGIKASSVVFNGAEIISISRNEDVVPANRFVETACDYLRGQFSDEQIKTLKLVRPIKDFSLDDGGEQVTLSALMSHRKSNRVKYVTVQVIRDGIILGRRELAFSIQYPCHRLMAKQSLSLGTIITPENTVIEEHMSNTPEQASVSLFYGMVTKRDISCGTTITETMVEQKESPVLIKKRQKVLLKLDMGGLFVSAPAEAIEDGHVGDIISVQRGSRRSNDLRIILGEVMPDGTVRPIL